MRRRDLLMGLGLSCVGGLIISDTEASDFDELRRLRVERDPSVDPAPRRSSRSVRRAAPADPRRSSSPVYVANAGGDLQATLTSWSQQAGWSIVWQSSYSYELTSGSRFAGSFEDSVKALLLAMRHTRPNPTAVFYGGNRVLVVSNKSQTATD